MGNFNSRLVAAFATAGWVFTLPVLVIAGVQSARMVTTYQDFIAALYSGLLRFLVAALVVILVSIFAIAYPVEKRLARKRYGTGRAILAYLAVFGSIAVLAALVTWAGLASGSPLHNVVAYPNSTLIIVVLYFGIVGGAVAMVSRLIYPLLYKRAKLSGWLAFALVILAATTLIQPSAQRGEVSETAPMGVGIYPTRLPGELARGTWTLDKKSGIAGTRFFVSGAAAKTRVNYELTFGCRPYPHSNDYVAIITDQVTGKQALKHTFTCSQENPTGVVNIAGLTLVPKVLLYPAKQYGNRPDAYAVLAPITKHTK